MSEVSCLSSEKNNNTFKSRDQVHPMIDLQPTEDLNCDKTLSYYEY